MGVESNRILNKWVLRIFIQSCPSFPVLPRGGFPSRVGLRQLLGRLPFHCIDHGEGQPRLFERRACFADKLLNVVLHTAARIRQGIIPVCKCNERRRLMIKIAAEQPQESLGAVSDVDIPACSRRSRRLSRPNRRGIAGERPSVADDLTIASGRKRPDVKLFFTYGIASLFTPPAVFHRWDCSLVQRL